MPYDYKAHMNKGEEQEPSEKKKVISKNSPSEFNAGTSKQTARDKKMPKERKSKKNEEEFGDDDSHVISLLKQMQKQLNFLEKKIDALVEGSGGGRGDRGRGEYGRSYGRKPGGDRGGYNRDRGERSGGGGYPRGDRDSRGGRGKRSGGYGGSKKKYGEDRDRPVRFPKKDD